MGKINLLNPTGHVMHQQFKIRQLYVLPTLQRMNDVGSTPSLDSVTKERPCTNVLTHRAATVLFNPTRNSVTLSSCYLERPFPVWAVCDNLLTVGGQVICTSAVDILVFSLM